MSVKGLLESEKRAKALQLQLERSFNSQLKELRQELEKVEYLLGDKATASAWANAPASPDRVSRLRNMLSEAERLYLEAGNTQAAKIFKQRMERQLRTRLTNLKANELEVTLRSQMHRAATEPKMLSSLTSIKREGAARELYMQSRNAGGVISGVGRGFMQDIVTMETKAAGSKTLGEYMNNLYKQYEKGLKDVFVKGIIRGDSYQQMENNLMSATNITKGKARILVRTEANAIFNESVRNVIDHNPLVKGYRFRAVLDRRTSKTCQHMDGKYIPKEDVKPGVNFPPLHPNCRSTVTTVLASENEKKDAVQRYTKNRENEWVPVPPGMKYPEFKRKMQEFDTMRPAPRTARYSDTLIREKEIRPDDHRITTVENTKIVPNVPGSAHMLSNQLGSKVSYGAQERYNKIVAREPKISASMIRMADSQGVRLYGIEYSAKTGPSVADKVEKKRLEFEKLGLSVTDEQIVDEMGDIIRYTVLTEHDNIVNTTEDFIEGFRSRGFKIEEIDNKYLEKDSTYKAVHLQVRDKENVEFEVQVHSERSLDIKNRTHALYKESEAVGVSKDKRDKLREEMKELVKLVPQPKDIDRLENVERMSKK